MPTQLYTSQYTAAALAYQQLKTLVLLGDVPIGLRLREERIADRLGISRTPVREALLRLHAEHFLERHPEGGFRVSNPSVQVMGELYEIRGALESFALQRGAAHGGHDRSVLEELRAEWESIDVDIAALEPEFVLVDEDFHARLAEAAGNQQLVTELRGLNERIRPVRTHDFVTPGRIASTIEQHLAIVEAVIGGGLERAQELLGAHIEQSRSVVEVAVARMLERMLSVGERDSSW